MKKDMIVFKGKSLKGNHLIWKLFLNMPAPLPETVQQKKNSNSPTRYVFLLIFAVFYLYILDFYYICRKVYNCH